MAYCAPCGPSLHLNNCQLAATRVFLLFPSPHVLQATYHFICKYFPMHLWVKRGREKQNKIKQNQNSVPAILEQLK